MMKMIVEPSGELEVVEEVDVLVVGGGPGGIGAALAAARNGARTLLVEQYNCLGGVATSGLMMYYSRLCGEGTDELIIAGVPRELYDHMLTVQGGETDEGGGFPR